MRKLLLILAILIGVAGISFWWVFLRGHSSITTTRVDRPFSIAAHSPTLIILGSGAAYAIVTGELNGTGKIEVIGNRGSDRREFIVGPGSFELAQGGAEDWIPDYRITYAPISATSGHLYAAVYCGEGMNESDRKLHHEISRRR